MLVSDCASRLTPFQGEERVCAETLSWKNDRHPWGPDFRAAAQECGRAAQHKASELNLKFSLFCVSNVVDVHCY